MNDQQRLSFAYLVAPLLGFGVMLLFLVIQGWAFEF